MTTPVWIGLGSNLGDRRAILDAAVEALNRTEGVTVVQVSTYRETLPVGGPPGQGPFLNAAARLDTTLSPRALLAETQRIEAELGRIRVVRWGERTLDIDLLIFGSKFVDEPDLKLPHPRLAVRRFVLEPLAEIDPDVVDPITGRTAVAMLANLDRLPRIVMLERSVARDIGGLVGAISRQLEGIGCYLDDLFVESTTLSDRKIGRYKEAVANLLGIKTLLQAGFPTIDRWIVVDSVYLPPNNLSELNSLIQQAEETIAGVTQHLIPGLGRAYPGFKRLPKSLEQGRQSLIRQREIYEGFPEPTVVIRPKNTKSDRLPSKTLTYKLEETEPDAIVAEVVAVCRGIAGG